MIATTPAPVSQPTTLGTLLERAHGAATIAAGCHATLASLSPAFTDRDHRRQFSGTTATLHLLATELRALAEEIDRRSGGSPA